MAAYASHTWRSLNTSPSPVTEKLDPMVRRLTVMTHAHTLAHVKMITPEQLMTLREQVFSPDEENITVAEAAVEALLTKWAQNNEKSKSGLSGGSTG